MTHNDFNNILDDFLGTMRETLETKGLDYTTDDDRLANFKSTGEDLERPALEVFWIFYKKHLDAIKNLCARGQLYSEPAKSRFLDAACYAILGYALWKETTEEKERNRGPLDMTPFASNSGCTVSDVTIIPKDTAAGDTLEETIAAYETALHGALKIGAAQKKGFFRKIWDALTEEP